MPPPRPHRRLRRLALALAALLVAFASAPVATAADTEARAKKPRGVIVNTAAASPGYTLYSPLELQRTYLIELDGTVAHSWKTSTQPGLIQYLLPNGHLLRAGNLKTLGVWKEGRGAGGRVEELDWDGNVVWQYEIADDVAMQHHDIAPLPNGNVLILAWERKTGNEALAAGRNPKLLSSKELWPEKIGEYSPATKSIVWEWHVWDHLVQERDPSLANYGDVSAHPEKIDLNYVLPGSTGDADWNHANAVAYNAELDQLMISSRSFSELWIVDHGITTEEARGPAGDLLFRYGNPAAYGKGGPVDQQLFVQHDPYWIPAGYPGASEILVFSNGLPEIREYSSVEQVKPTMENGQYMKDANGVFTSTSVTVYPKKTKGALFSAIISSAQRFPNGNTLVTYGPQGLMVEVDESGKIVWEYENTRFTVRKDTPKETGAGVPIQPWWTFRAKRYDPAYSGLADLNP
ncbi:MAG: aryl-sulfate sulfotransferase [Acidimicrobiia bacterium]